MWQLATVLCADAAARSAAALQLTSNGIAQRCLRYPQREDVPASRAAVASGAQTQLQFSATFRARAIDTLSIPARANIAQTAGWICSAPCTQTRDMGLPPLLAPKAVPRAVPLRVWCRVRPRRRARWHADARPCCEDITAETCCGACRSAARASSQLSRKHLRRASRARHASARSERRPRRGGWSLRWQARTQQARSALFALCCARSARGAPDEAS